MGTTIQLSHSLGIKKALNGRETITAMNMNHLVILELLTTVELSAHRGLMSIVLL
jgi:hypothetical protein